MRTNLTLGQAIGEAIYEACYQAGHAPSYDNGYGRLLVKEVRLGPMAIKSLIEAGEADPKGENFGDRWPVRISPYRGNRAAVVVVRRHPHSRARNFTHMPDGTVFSVRRRTEILWRLA